MRIALPALFQAFHAFLPAGRVNIVPAPHAVQELQKGAILVRPRPRGVQLQVVSGEVWITHDGDLKDVVLGPGERYTAEQNARMLVSALEDATVLLH